MKTTLLIFLVIAIVLCGGATAFCMESDTNRCYPITVKDLIDKHAPKFSDFKANDGKLQQLLPPNLKSHPLAKKYRTVLKSGASQGPNFAGHYAVVGWGCGSSCLQFAVVDLKTGEVIFPEDFNTVSGVHLAADDFEPQTDSEYWGLRYKKESNLIIVLGTLDENIKEEGGFYYIIDKNKLKKIYSVITKKDKCWQDKYRD